MGYSPWGCKESDTSEQLLALWASLGAQMLRPALCTGFPSGSDGKASACNAGDLGLSVGWEDPLEKEMATHSSTLAWKIPWMEEPGRLQSRGHKELDSTERLHFKPYEG